MYKLSIIVPVWNEEENIKTLVNRIHASLKSEGIEYEIIFIDDNSTDNSAKTIKYLANFFPISYHLKQGKNGKAYSLYEGFQKAEAETIAMIDADLQYPPEALPEMYKKIHKGADIVVAKRKQSHISPIRKITSNAFRYFFGKILFGLNTDTQAGLKIFRKKVIDTIMTVPKSGWTFDLEFLHRATQAGFIIENHNITFEKRLIGKSKISILTAALEIGFNALKVKFTPVLPIKISRNDGNGMLNAQVGYKKKQYTIHTNLSHRQSALKTLTVNQKMFIFLLFLILIFGFLANIILTFQILIGFLSFIYLLDVLFNFWIIVRSLKNSKEIVISDEDLKALSLKDLPVYTILCPLYKEAHVLPHFLRSIQKLDYPKHKLDVLLLLEADDKVTVDIITKTKLPSFVRTVIVPDGQPKTKPKACNYGLQFAKGEYVVIYDAEDMPDPMQLKKAYLGFQKSQKNIVCLQAKLNYYNPHQNLLTRLFTAEYSLWFDVTLTGLQTLNTSIPLGGTSNHFRKKDLITLQGWDPFNVAEDADLGIRLFRKGYQTAMINSTTLEEANSKLGNWIRQRSRWIKGYMQTYFVHTRDLFGFGNTKKKKHSLVFHLIVGGKIAFILINPLLWITTISYFIFRHTLGPTIELLFPPIVFYTAIFSFIAGNFLFIYYYMIGAAKNNQWNLIKFTILVPFYWLLISFAGFIAFFQLIFKPHYWEKTVHGFHLETDFSTLVSQTAIEAEESQFGTFFPVSVQRQLKKTFGNTKVAFSGFLLIMATGLANFSNLLFNIYLGRSLNLDNFAFVSLINGFLYLSKIPTGALGSAANYKSGILEGAYGYDASRTFWKKLREKAFGVGLFFVIVWAILAPILSIYFKTSTVIPFLIFSSVILVSFLAGVDRGFLSGKLFFGALAFLTLVEPITKFFSAAFLLNIHRENLVYVSIPISIIITFLFGWVFALTSKKGKKLEIKQGAEAFPSGYFFGAVLSGLSSMTFLSMDVVLARHFLSPEDAGSYALISLVGKMIFFAGSLVTQFLAPLVSRKEGAKANSDSIFKRIYISTFALTFTGFLTFGLFGKQILPIIYGTHIIPVIPYVLPFAFGMMCFALAKVFESYYLNKKIYTFSILSFGLSILQFVLISMFHKNVASVVFVMASIGLINFSMNTLLHYFISVITVIENNVADLIGLFAKPEEIKKKGDSFSILIYNWRDTKHVWAGGAELYVQTLAEKWVKMGNSVTLFCGNDNHNKREETINGVRIIRRGGFYTVYVWAFLYYILRFRGNFDVVVDSENGIPFFTPLFVHKPKFLLIHHIHQEVFRKHLVLPLALVAQYLEGVVAPFVYKKTRIVTVSESTKKGLEKFGFGTKIPITVIYPGVHNDLFKPGGKTFHPSAVYLGRLKPYKNIDIVVKAFKEVVGFFPHAVLTIAGTGESLQSLLNLTKKLGLEKQIIFEGAVTDAKKAGLLSQSWVALQPSMIEGFGITVIEANASGTPVIASNVPGLRDSVVDGKTGILVPVGSVEGFSDAIVKCFVYHDVRKKISKEALIWSGSFSWDISAEKFYSLITEEFFDSQKKKMNLAQNLALQR